MSNSALTALEDKYPSSTGNTPKKAAPARSEHVIGWLQSAVWQKQSRKRRYTGVVFIYAFLLFVVFMRLFF